MKKIIVVGLGLIGGSIAKSLKRHTNYQIYGIDIYEDVLLDACSAGVIDGKADDTDISEADIIYLCTYPAEAIAFTEKYKNEFKSGCIVTDTCGVKAFVCEQISQIAGKFVFVGAHPMAGKEKNGFAASDPSIFVGASYIITPENAPDWAVRAIEELAIKMGFGRVIKTTPQEHDKMIAFTSQLPHVIACAYVLSPSCGGHNGFSAGSYRDVSRVADINATLWSGLFTENKEELINELDVFLVNLKQIRDLIEETENEDLQALLNRAAEIKRRDHI